MPVSRTNRRAFVAGLGSAATWPVVTQAQRPAVPVIGVLGGTSADAFFAFLDPSYRQGLKERGYVADQDVTIEYRWADGQLDKLPFLARELVSRPVSVILSAGGNASALAAQAATAKIPIVLGNVGVDPVKLGLVASLNRPGGNITGMAVLSSTLWSKRLELLHELIPQATVLGVLVNPSNPTLAESTVVDVQSAASKLGLKVRPLKASTESDIEEAFKQLVEFRADLLAVGSDIFFAFERTLIVKLANRYGIPAIYGWREDAEGGGLISYGANLPEMYRQAGMYTGRILQGEKPSELPVQQATKFDMVINLKTAKNLGLAIPPRLLALADEVIE